MLLISSIFFLDKFTYKVVQDEGNCFENEKNTSDGKNFEN